MAPCDSVWMKNKNDQKEKQNCHLLEVNQIKMNYAKQTKEKLFYTPFLTKQEKNMFQMKNGKFPLKEKKKLKKDWHTQWQSKHIPIRLSHIAYKTQHNK